MPTAHIQECTETSVNDTSETSIDYFLSTESILTRDIKTIKFIPKNLLSKTRDIMISLMDKIVENPNEEENYFRFLAFPVENRFSYHYISNIDSNLVGYLSCVISDEGCG